MKTPDPFAYIEHATNERLAEMLDEWLKDLHTLHMEVYDSPSGHLIGENEAILKECARRLRIPPHITFNDEYFDI